MADSGNIKVVVRCRPMNSRERARGASNLIEVKDQHQLVLSPPGEGDSRENSKATKKKAMPFSFDRAYDENTEQRTLFEYIGVELLAHAFNGFNTCVFAYGQTGSGKSHSMVGYAEAKGLIPLTCSKLFDDVTDKMAANPHLKISVEVSYIEIYNEKVRDLLNPKNKGNLKVREHPSLGPYVEDLSKLIVSSFKDIENLMDEGNKARTVAATNMNETSSRSHAVFTLVLTQKMHDVETRMDSEKVSRISLVDLAGSERANSTGATGARLKEGANINRSLTTLGKVIAALATASMDPPKGKKKAALDNFVPYRDSVLTWLLKDSLGGNSKTAMIAAISPADYEETLSTLRYADQAKKIKNKAVVNEDPNAKLIRELKEELEMLRNRVKGGGSLDGEGSWDPNVPPEQQVVRYQTKTGEIKTVTKAELQDQLEQSEKIMSSLNESWEEKLQKTQQIQKEREKALEELGISVDKDHVGVHTPKRLPHLVNLNEDPLMSECLIYQIKPGNTMVGNLDGESAAQIRLSGSNILPEHCYFESSDGAVMIHAMPESMTMVNGKRVTPGEPRRLRSGYRVILGDFHVFRFNHPEEVRKARDRVKSTLARSTGEAENETMGTDSPNTRPDSPASGDGCDVDWTYARREAALARLNGQDVNFDKLNEEDLEKLFEDISRARSKKTGNGRPESRASYFDDTESQSSYVRPYSLSTFTDDTSIDPWSQGGGGGSDVGSMRANQHRQKEPLPEVAAREAEDLKIKVKEYEERLNRLTAAAAATTPGESGGFFFDLPVEFTGEQRRLLQWALAKWKSHTKVSMAEDILSNAVHVKEANVISKELGKRVSYQFTIVDQEPLANPSSSVEAIAGLTEFDDVADPELACSPKPCTGIKVYDHAHRTTYVWSIAKFLQRLQKMRNLYTFVDRPEYSQHFNWADPFYESPSPSFAFIGNALVPLKPLSRQISARYRVPIMSRHMAKSIGTCSVEVKFVSLTAPPLGRTANGRSQNGSHNGISSPAISISSQSRDTDGDPLPAGHKLGLQICVDTVSGFSKDEFQSVHAQVRLSSIVGPSISKDDVYTSVPIDLSSESSLSEIKLRRTISFILTPESVQFMRNGYAPIEFFAKLKPAHLEAIESHDAEKEGTKLIKPVPDANGSLNGKSDAGGLKPSSMTTTTGRLSENEMVSEEQHHVLAFVQVCELDASGDYKPVQVRAQSGLDPGSFFLRQGLQRKLVLRLSHDSGRQFPWVKVTKLELGDVRLLDPRGRIHVSGISDPVQLQVPAKQQSLEFLANGTSELSLWAWWDSSVHDSLYLNRATASGHRVLLKLDFQVQVETCSQPAKFSMDVAVSINARDAKPSGKLMSMIESAANGSRVLTKTSALFGIKLVPPLTKKTKELWRLDTGARYIRGEEALLGWKARGLSLVQDHSLLVRAEKRRAEVEGVRALLRANPPLSLSMNGGIMAGARGENAILEKALGAWKRSVSDSRLSILELTASGGLSEESEEGKEQQQPLPSPSPLLEPFRSPRPDSLLSPRADSYRSPRVGSSSSALSSPGFNSPRPESIRSSSSPNGGGMSQKRSEGEGAAKLTAQVTIIPRTDTAVKKGWLMTPVETFTDRWIKRFFVLRRPFLYVYEASSELEEIMAINVKSCKVEHDENVERMLERENVFGVYTSSNSYFFQAPSAREMESWIRALDSFHSTRQA
ncbi:kinesin-domain-containing protein [Violaceomyces palustris]|uniref:Kinesin-domain-containing protein n=1 Tax=Violaceomyces palustris TaxID=1673888 RepID=A0ACD0P826_9BASI|nr:kinesin-domain-containing protein [Violaceomyces palustris]